MKSESLHLIKEARATCSACPLYHVCPLAPLFLQTNALPRPEHPHKRTLAAFLLRLRELTTEPQRQLLEAMASNDEPLALVASCMLAVSLWDNPGRLRQLLTSIRDKSTTPRQLSPLENHLQRAGALLVDKRTTNLLVGTYRMHRGEREASVYEAMRLVTRLIAGEPPEVWLETAVSSEDRAGFNASFVLRQIGADAKTSSLDLFFTARAGSKSSVFYYRRSHRGTQSINPISAIRPDSLLQRLFKVFDTDARKTHRLFAKIARYLNNHYRDLDKHKLWQGLQQLSREHQIILSLYAPKLAKFVEQRAQLPGLYRLTKFLHRHLRTTEAPEDSSHSKLFQDRAQVASIMELYAKDAFKDFCRHVFRISESFKPSAATSDLIFRIGEATYYVTAMAGLNAAGLEFGLQGANPMAYIAYGLQPVSKNPRRRWLRLQSVRARLVDADAPAGLVEAVDQGCLYMAAMHGHEDVDAFRAALEQGSS